MDLVVGNTDNFWWIGEFNTKKNMNKRLIPFSVFLIFLIVFVIFYKGLEDTNIYTPDVKIKEKIPIFKTVEFFSGKSLLSSGIFDSDKTYLLNIWSSWCVPCRKEHPLLMDLNKENELTIIGINYRDKKNNAINFLNELGNPYKEILIDPDGIISIEWGAYGVPESFLIREDRIIKKYVGPLNSKIIKEIKLIIK